MWTTVKSHVALCPECHGKVRPLGLFPSSLLRPNGSLLLLLFFKPTSTKPQAEILTLNKVNGCNDVSFSDHSVLEGDRIPPLKSHGQSLEEELCFPGVLSDNCDAPANLEDGRQRPSVDMDILTNSTACCDLDRRPLTSRI